MMPAVFVGHGSPMNAIEDNEFSRGWRELARSLPRPTAILCISAHWETAGAWTTAMENPRTIHDFGGFPPELYRVRYPAPGSPQLAAATQAAVQQTDVGLDRDWGLDHGAWSVLRQMYPEADLPVVQLSLDRNKDPRSHYALGRELMSLRRQNVLVLGSGNLVHNLRRMAPDEEFPLGLDWAIEASALLKKLIREDRHGDLMNYPALGKAVRLAVPTPEHYLPMLYVLALKGREEQVSFFNDKPFAGSLTMTSFAIR
jgi:4,5-DOPA dioxygenase extradiol